MAVEIPMPRLSQTTDEVKLLRWLVKPGDPVSKGQALCEVENDKTTMEVESFAAGTVLRLQGEPESMISAGTVIAVLGEAGEKVEAGGAGAGPASAPVSRAEAPASAAAAAGAAAAGTPARAPAGISASPEGVRATPLVRNLARKHGVDLARVRGTGARGLITREDLDAYLRGGEAAPAAQPAATAAPPIRPVAPAAPGRSSEVSLSAHQQAVARAVSAAKSQVPHYYLVVPVDAGRLQAWRGANLRADGGKVAVDAVLAWACARALVRHPKLNGTFRDGRLQLYSQANVGVAVAAGEELHVPVIRRANGKDIREIDRELDLLSAKARSGALAGQEIAEGTFTISNLGMYPVESFTAVLNAPQVALVAAGRIAPEVTADAQGAIRVRPVLRLSGSFDHRAVNGAQGAAFLAEIKRILEEEL
jgi:pyruvate dehydrogenase E2 component (dihydrolipoamide acetyltransferase)